MARRPMVTRTIKSTEVKVLGINLANNQTGTKSVVIPRTYETDKEIIKYLTKNNVFNNDFAPVKVVDSVIHEALYGMPEEDFIKFAQEIETED